MNIIHGYRDDKALRDSFNRLAEQTFCLNFEGWYQNGFWGDNYDPHSIVIDGEVVSNVSVNRTDLVFGGRRYHILQLGTVMTAPEYRGRGLNRAIMEYIEREYADADGIYLYIPRRADHRQSWGSSTRYREELRQRNESIRHLHQEGLDPAALAERFHLSVKSIQRILREK